MLRDEIIEELCKLQDKEYGEFQAKLTPSVEGTKVIGVRTPELRKYAKELVKRNDISEFLEMLPHEYFDENKLHAFIISEQKDYLRTLKV